MIQIKLLEIQKKWIALKKDANNPFFRSKYITLDSIIETYNPILTELSVLAYHYTQDNKLVTCLFDTEDSTKVESQFNVYNNDPQKQGSEITYWKRYNLSQLLNIQTDEDDDGNKASSEWNTKQFYKKKPYTKKQFIELAEAFNSGGRELALWTYSDQTKDFEITKSIEEKVKQLSEIFKQNQKIDDIDSIWKDAEATRKEALWQ